MRIGGDQMLVAAKLNDEKVIATEKRIKLKRIIPNLSVKKQI
jgi:hypothetical protein